MTLGLALWAALALAACGGDDKVGPQDTGEDDTSAPDTRDAEGDTDGEDTLADGAGPDGAETEPDSSGPTLHALTLTVTAPSGQRAAGWELLNRFGRWIADSEGTATIEVAPLGLTLTLALPPGDASEDPRVPAALVFATIHLEDREAPASASVGVSEAAAGLVLLDPRLATEDPLLLRGALDRALVSPKVAALGAAIRDHFDTQGTRSLLSEPGVLAALDAAVDEVGAAVGAAWAGPGRLPSDHHAGAAVEVGRLGSRAQALVELVPVADGAVSVVPLPLVPGVVRVSAQALDLDHGALVRADDLGDAALATVARGDAVTLWTNEVGQVLPWREGVVELSVVLDDGPAGERALAQQMAARTFPGARCAAAPEGFRAALAAEMDCRRGDAREVAAGTRLSRLMESVAARALTRRLEERPLGLDPTSTWAPFAEPLKERLRVAIGAPFTPQPTVSGAPVWGQPLTLTGPLMARPETRVVLRDEAGRRRVMTRTAPPFTFTVPEDMGGPLVAEVYAAGGATELALGAPPIEVASVWPPILDRVREVRLRGRGFYEGGQILIGGQSVTLPRSAADEVFVTLDPAAVGVGSHTVGAGTLRVPDRMYVLEDPPPGNAGGTRSYKLRGLWVDTPLTARMEDGQPIEILAQTESTDPNADVEVLVDTTHLPWGIDRVYFSHLDQESSVTTILGGGHWNHDRSIEFFSTSTTNANAMLVRALGMANGTHQPEGTFRRLGVGSCPLDIQPEEFSYRNCPEGQFCDDGWIYDDQRNPAEWWKITRPPGRLTTSSRCAEIPGVYDWRYVFHDLIMDTISSNAVVPLQGATLIGPRVRLTLPKARGGGLTITGRNANREAYLDLVVTEATSTAEVPVITVADTQGVFFERLHIKGRVSTCRVGLRIINSSDVDVKDLVVEGCQVGVEVINSRRVQIGKRGLPAGTLDTPRSMLVRGSRDVNLNLSLGALLGPGTMSTHAGNGGLVIEDSASILVSGTAISMSDAALTIRDSVGVRVRNFEVGIVRMLNGAAVSFPYVAEGIQVLGTSRDVELRDLTVYAAAYGVKVADEAVVRMERVALGGVHEACGRGPLTFAPKGNREGLLVLGGDVVVDQLCASRNQNHAVRVEGGRLLVRGMTTASKGGGQDYVGAQPCAVSVASGRARVEDAHLVQDEVGACVTGGSLDLVGSAVEPVGAGVLVEQGQVHLEGAQIMAEVQVNAGEATLEDVELEAAGVGLRVEGTAAVRGGSIVADEAVAVEAGLLWLEDAALRGRVGLTVRGADPGGAPGVVARGAIFEAEEDVVLEGAGEVVLDGALWRTLSSVDRTVRTTSADEAARTVRLGGSADLRAHAEGPLQVEAQDHDGRVRLTGGAMTLRSVGPNEIDVAAREVAGAIDGGRVTVRGGRVTDELRCERCQVSLSGLVGPGRVTVTGGVGHTLSEVRVDGGVTLARWAEAFMTGVSPVSVGAGMPLARLAQSGGVTWIEGVPDRARVALRAGPELVAWVQALGGRARWVGEDALEGAVTAHGATGAWHREGRATSCDAPVWPISESAVVSGLRWETEGGWSDGGANEVTTCGERVARVLGVQERRLEVDGVEVAAATDLGDIAFDARCEQVAWVGVVGTRDVFVTALESGVTTRVSEDARAEARPQFGPDGALWFGYTDGSALAVARDGEVTEAVVLGLELHAPAPSPDGRGVAFIACGASCRLAWWEHGAWSYLDTAALGREGPCEASEPRWLQRPGEPALLAYVREGQLVLASASGVVMGALAEDVLRVR